MFLHLPLAEQDIKPEKDEFRGKRPRGRPPKLSRDSGGFFFDNQKKTKHGRMLVALRDAVYTVNPFGLFQIGLTFGRRFCLHLHTNTYFERSVWHCLSLQRPVEPTFGSSSGTSLSTRRRTQAWWNGKTGGRGSSSSSSLRLSHSCGDRRKRTVAWPTRSSAGPWGKQSSPPPKKQLQNPSKSKRENGVQRASVVLF